MTVPAPDATPTASPPGASSPPSAPAHRRRGLVAVVVAVVLVVAAAAVAADRLAVGYAERTIASSVADQLGLAEAPQVHVTGFPFLTQLARHRFDRIELSASDLALGADPAVTLQTCEVVLTDVTEEADAYRVAELAGQASLGWDQVTTLIGQPITYDEAAGRASVEVNAEVLGMSVAVTLSGVPVLDVEQQRLEFTEGKIAVGGNALPDLVAEALIDQFLQPVSLQLPYEIRVSGLHLSAAAIGLDVVGTDVVLPR